MEMREQMSFTTERGKCEHKYILKEIIKRKGEEQGYRQYPYTKIERYFCEKCLTSKDLIFEDICPKEPCWY